MFLAWRMELHPNIPPKAAEFAITWWTSPLAGLTRQRARGNLRHMQ
jgi:hypothetical protein